MRPGDLPPDDPVVGSPLLCWGLVDVGNLLSEVEVGRLGVVNPFDLDETRLGVGCVPATLVAKMLRLQVQAVTRSRRHLDSNFSSISEDRKSRKIKTSICVDESSQRS